MIVIALILLLALHLLLFVLLYELCCCEARVGNKEYESQVMESVNNLEFRKNCNLIKSTKSKIQKNFRHVLVRKTVRCGEACSIVRNI